MPFLWRPIVGRTARHSCLLDDKLETPKANGRHALKGDIDGAKIAVRIESSGPAEVYHCPSVLTIAPRMPALSIATLTRPPETAADTKLRA